MKFLSILATVGKGFAKGLAWAMKYGIPAERLAAVIFPQAAPVANAAIAATTIVQNAVLEVEQKYAAQGKQAETGPQKLADVLSLTESTVTQLLSAAGVKADTAYVTSLINAVVAVLNVQPAVAEPEPVPAA